MAANRLGRSGDAAAREPENFGAEFLDEVPLDLQIRETSDSKRPIAISDPDNPHALVFRAIARRIWEKIAGTDAVGRAPPRIVVE